LHERDDDYANGELKHDISLVGYGPDYGYNQHEQHKNHEAYGHGQDGRGHETERSKQHELPYHQAQPNTEPEGPEEGEAYEEGDYQYLQAAEEHKTET
jgi:U1 small nuclear ribonucleoprotein